MSFPTYLEYREGGVASIGKVPAHWKINSVKHLTSRISSGKTPLGGSETYVDEGVTFLRSQNVYDEGLRLEDVVFISKEVDESMTVSRVQPGDILLNITGASIGRSCLVPGGLPSANVNQHVCAVRLNNVLQIPFVGWFFKSAAIKNQIDLAQNGAAREGLNFDQIGRMTIPMPPIQEQSAIAAFLDRETGKIDALITEQERLLILLAEKRQATISHAVTRGLNPDAPMKDSGVPWLGDLPAHWSMTRLKWLSPAITVGIVVNPSEYVADEGLPFIYGGDISEGRISIESCRRISEENSLRQSKTRLEEGDLLTVRVGAPGITAVVPANCVGGNCASVMHVRKGDFDSAWLCYAMNSRMVRYQVEVVQYGAAQEQFNISHAVNFWIATPPKDEQTAVSSYVSNEIQKIGALASEAVRAIALLKERRSALIAAAVTGKIDVRQVA